MGTYSIGNSTIRKHMQSVIDNDLFHFLFKLEFACGSRKNQAYTEELVNNSFLM